jgi:transposase
MHGEGVRSGHLRPTLRGNSKLEPLNSTDDKAYKQNVNRTHAVVCKHWPELAQIIGFHCATAQTLVHHYAAPQAVLQNSHKARDLMQRVGGHLLQKEKIDAVIDSAKATLGVPQLEAEREVVQNFAGLVLHYRQLRAKAEVKIRKLIKKTPPAK